MLNSNLWGCEYSVEGFVRIRQLYIQFQRCTGFKKLIGGMQFLGIRGYKDLLNPLILHPFALFASHFQTWPPQV